MEIARKIYAFLLDAVQTLLVAAAVFLVIYMFLFRPFEVNGQSMYPNFHDREYVLTNLIALKFGNPKLGDIVVFKAPDNPEKDFIKRVIGVAGDNVMIKDGDVYLNGQLLDQDAFLTSEVKTYAGAFLKEGIPVTIPQGEYFVMGDNRSYSSDSREWGFVKQDELIGKSFLVYWPISEMRLVSNPYK